MKEMINLLKDQITKKGEQWQATRENELVLDCAALVDAVNSLEERVHGERITNINMMLP